MKFISIKTKDGEIKGKTALYCRVLDVSRQAFYDHLKNKDKPWKHSGLAEKIRTVIAKDEYNDTYGRERMRDALVLEYPDEDFPSKRTIYRVIEQAGIELKTKHKPRGITKSDKNARKSDDLLKRDFTADEPFKKAVTDITELKCKDGKLYCSADFDCFSSEVLGIAMADNMRAELCAMTIENACRLHPELRGAVVHSDRGSQYTSELYRAMLTEYGIIQSMNSAGGRCHDNARCESFWARMKEEMFYSRGRKTEDYTAEELKSMVWWYFMSYWNNRRICSANGGLPPTVKRKQFCSTRRGAA